MDTSILDVHYTCRIWGKKFSSWALQDDVNFAKKEQERRKQRRQNNKKENDVKNRIRSLLKKNKKGQKSNKFKIIFNKNNNLARIYRSRKLLEEE